MRTLPSNSESDDGLESGGSISGRNDGSEFHRVPSNNNNTSNNNNLSLIHPHHPIHRLLRTSFCIPLVFACALAILLVTIAGLYARLGGLTPGDSGFGCDFSLTPPHLSNRSVSYSMCTQHDPISVDMQYSFSPVSTAISFLVVGDFGRDGLCCQRDVAFEMARAARCLGVSFLVNVGDAFYEYGLLSPNEEQVRTSFTDVYDVFDDLKTLPWISVLGNHEYRGNPLAVLNLTSVIGPRWIMPSRYFELILSSSTPTSIGGVQIQLVVLDTSPMIKKYHETHYDDHADTMINQPAGISTQWNSVQDQLKWLDVILSDPKKPKIKIVFGHHPPYTSGSHYGEDESFLRNNLGPILEKNRVCAYFSGHDHNLQHYHIAGTHVHYFVSAGGSKVEGAFTMADDGMTYFDQINGFAAVLATNNGLKVSFIDYTGVVIHTVDIPY
jgi:tartrate-resistant acid phosphatase type 5